MSSALFGSGSVRSKNLVEFKAGRMNLKGKMVHPDKRKGLIFIHQLEDSLMHFCWKDRTNGIIEDDLIIFPDEVEIKKVPQCTTGRVYLMRFKTSNKKLFFWMQETDAEKDEKLWKRVNDLLNNPSSAASSSSVTSATGGSGGGGVGTASGSGGGGTAAAMLGAELAEFGSQIEGPQLQNLIGSMSDQQLQMFLGGFMPVNSPTTSSNRSSASLSASNQASRVQSTTSRTEPPTSAAAAAATSAPSASTTTTTTSAPAVDTAVTKPATGTENGGSTNGDSTAAKMQFSDFQNILGSLAQAGRGNGSSSDIDLSDVLTLDVMAPILSNKDVQARLVEHLPESPDILPKNEHELRRTLTTPQFKKALSSFCMALQSGQLGPVFKQFDLPDEVSNAAAQGNLEAFARAMEAHAKEKKTASATKKAQDDDAMDTK